MSLLREKLEKSLPPIVENIKKFVAEHGDKAVSDVTVSQAFGGMRGVKSLVCDTSVVPPDKGLIIRGIELKDLWDKTPEEVFWLLVTGELPSEAEIANLKEDMKSREQVPSYVWHVIDHMPDDSHPMAMFSTAVLVMQKESVFSKEYMSGNLKKEDYWKPTLEDFLNIMAKLPAIAAYVYRRRFGKGPRIESNSKLDLSANYAHMLGVSDSDGSFADLMRLYLVLHSDHEGGNASAFTAAIISSTLSDMYYSLSGGLNALAGPLHGLANQNCLKWVLGMMDKFGGEPSETELEKYTWDTLDAGQVIPGYGHAVLRVTDPRFQACIEFGKQHMADDPVFSTVHKLYNVVPKVLKQIDKIQNPWPNVDAGSGALLYHYGVKELSYYTVLFSVSRAMGIGAQAVMARAYGLPITRPKSLPTKRFMEIAGVK